MPYIISGIQQVGIGVRDVKLAYAWYSRNFGMDIPIFEEAAVADRMLPYTGGTAHSRHAVLALNIKGGGGFEIWQYTSRNPQPPEFEVRLGDLGIFCAKIKSDNVEASRNLLREQNVDVISEVLTDPSGKKHFFLRDKEGNLFQVTEGEEWFARGLRHTGGTAGAMIGVSDMDKAIAFYSGVLEYDNIVFRQTGVFPDLASLPGGNQTIERVLLSRSNPAEGPFSQLLGRSHIELVRANDRNPSKIFSGRYWGDLGFIHLCFDVRNMAELKKACELKGFPFTVDGGIDFDMGQAKGHFCYVEDPDGTLIEFVEAKKIPILKKFGWYLDLDQRPAEKPLPRWMLRALKLNRKKEI
jgi:catechol 2,3-dioxygenase-like lactoylglutathione lyase family enzyme